MSRRIFYYVRTNGLKRFLYLTCPVIASRWLEPLRRLAVEFVVLPGTRKRQVLAPWIAVGLIGTVVMLLWDEAAEVWGKAFELTPVLALVESLWDEALWLLLLVLLAVYFKYVHAKLAVALRVRYWQVHKQELLKAGAAGYILTVECLGLQEERLETLKEELEESREVVIADIDQDGLLLSRYGSIPGAVATAPESFMERKRLALEVVATGDQIGVKKYYRGDKACFLNELECLHTLAGRCNTPAILDVGFANLTLTFSYIPGVVLREELSRRGARLLNRDVDGNPDFMHLTREDRRLKCIEEGKRVLYDCVDPAQVDDIFTEIKRAHKAGVCICDVKYGNIIFERDSREPYLIDFDRSHYHGHSHGLRWEVERDGDIEQFNLCFNTEKLTRDRSPLRLHEPTYHTRGDEVIRTTN